MIETLLIANRGEIARRVMRTARSMGIRTVAVYAESDSNAPFVADADDGVGLDGVTAIETYLDIAKILAAAERTGADAVHPGYGFLSENAEAARACEAAGLTWVGPSPDAIAAMGDKIAAKQMMSDAGVPTLPSGEPSEIGFPLLVKASAGGGGRGMRIVESPDDLDEALASAQREVAGAFGDDRVFCERYLPSPRHVEIQLLGDTQGNLLHLFERECSIQRRHQKIIEEAPSPAMTLELRELMGQAAITAGKAIGYFSAGTVEFLVDGDSFFFLEVNTRLQVEHPVTEAITGVDLVREQLRIANGEALAFAQSDLAIDGHAIEARLYAEDPAADFLPQAGSLLAWDLPSGPGLRIDSGVEVGTIVSPEFDPMLAKVVSHAPTRAEAAARLALGLEQAAIWGVRTNRDFLVATLRHPEFLAGNTTTAFIEQADPDRARTVDHDELQIAGVIVAIAAQGAHRAKATVWHAIRSGWRNTPMPPQEVRLRHGDDEIVVTYESQRDGAFRVGEQLVRVHRWDGTQIDVEIDGRRHQATVLRAGDRWWVHTSRGSVEFVEVPRFPVVGMEVVEGGLVAPMPAKVVAIEVATGESVTSGQLLLVLEAMKMEHRISAPTDGVVADVLVTIDEQVDNGALLIVLQ